MSIKNSLHNWGIIKNAILNRWPEYISLCAESKKTELIKVATVLQEVKDNITEVDEKPPIPTAILFIVHEQDGSRMYFTDESFAKKSLFDVSVKYFNTTTDDDYSTNEDDDDTQEPYLEAFAKGKWANLQFLYKIKVNLEDLTKLSIKQKCEIVDIIGSVEHNKNFPI